MEMVTILITLIHSLSFSWQVQAVVSAHYLSLIRDSTKINFRELSRFTLLYLSLKGMRHQQVIESKLIFANLNLISCP